MENIYKLKELLIQELDELGEKQSLDVGSLDLVDKLAHAAKNICKVIESCEESYSNTDGMNRSYRGTSYRDNSYADGRSYARGRMNAPRDTMGRYSGMDGYSRHGGEKAIEILDDLRGIVRELPSDAKHAVERIIKQHEDVYA